MRRDSLPNAGSFAYARRSSIPIDVSSFLSPSFSPTQYLDATLTPTGNLPSGNQPLINNETLMAVHRSLSITRDKVHSELQRTAISNAELLVECGALRSEMEKELDNVVKQMEQLNTLNEVQQEEEQPLNKELEDEPEVIVEEGVPKSPVDQQVKELIDALSGVNLTLVDPSNTHLLKQGQVNELHGSIDSLHTKPVHVIVLSDAVLICNIKGAASSSPTKKRFFSSSKKDVTPGVEGKMAIDRCLPFATTTLFDITDSQYVQSCIKLKSVDSPELGTKAESVLLSVGAEKHEWMTAFKDAIDAFRGRLKSKSMAPHPARKSIAKRERVEDMKHVRDTIEGLLSDLSNARQLCAYDAALEHIDKLNYQFSKNEKALSLSEHKYRLAQETDELAGYMLSEIRRPVISKPALMGCINNLSSLQKSDLAQDAFLHAKSEVIRSKVSVQKCAGDASRSIDTLSRTYIDLIRQTVDLYRELFSDARMLSELVLWVRVELISMLGMVHRQLPLVEDVGNVKESIKSRVSGLQDTGIDLLPIVNNFFDTPLPK